MIYIYVPCICIYKYIEIGGHLVVKYIKVVNKTIQNSRILRGLKKIFNFYFQLSKIMNRFEYADSRLFPNEIYIRRDFGICLYDGDVKVCIINYSYRIKHNLHFFDRQILKVVN